jgi:hypothetical protein
MIRVNGKASQGWSLPKIQRVGAIKYSNHEKFEKS